MITLTIFQCQHNLPQDFRKVSPQTVIAEVVLGFLSLTIEVVSFDPEKGW